MLANPRLTPQQRQKIQAMKSRRMAKESAAGSSVSSLVRTASPATQAALRSAMSELAKAKGNSAPRSSPVPVGAELARTLTQLSNQSGVPKQAITEVLEVLPSYTIGDLRLLLDGFRQYLHRTSQGWKLSRQAFQEVLAKLACDPLVGPLWATKGFAFFEIMFERFKLDDGGVSCVEFFCTLATICHGTLDGKVSFMFEALNLDNNGFVSIAECLQFSHGVANIAYALQQVQQLQRLRQLLQL